MKLGDFSSISTVLFSRVLISVWAAGIYYLGNELSQPWPLILFTCEQSVYSIDTKNFCAKLICSARDNIFRCLCWIWEAVKLIIPAFSYQIVDCSILLLCSLSGVELFLSRERKKDNSVLFSFWSVASGDAEQCDPWGSLQIVRWGYIEKAEISYRRPCIEKFQIQLTFDTPGFKLPFGSGHYRWCCLKAADSTIRALPRTRQGWAGLLSMSCQILTPKALSW